MRLEAFSSDRGVAAELFEDHAGLEEPGHAVAAQQEQVAGADRVGAPTDGSISRATRRAPGPACWCAAGRAARPPSRYAAPATVWSAVSSASVPSRKW